MSWQALAEAAPSWRPSVPSGSTTRSRTGHHQARRGAASQSGPSRGDRRAPVLFTEPASPKVRDLESDARYALHGTATSEQPGICASLRSRAQHDASKTAMYERQPTPAVPSRATSGSCSSSSPSKPPCPPYTGLTAGPADSAGALPDARGPTQLRGRAQVLLAGQSRVARIASRWASPTRRTRARTSYGRQPRAPGAGVAVRGRRAASG